MKCRHTPPIGHWGEIVLGELHSVMYNRQSVLGKDFNSVDEIEIKVGETEKEITV